MSFFSFQDIIACTTGIMVLVTLLLTLELITRVPNAPDQDHGGDPTALEKAVTDATRERDDLQSEVTEQRRRIDDLVDGDTITPGRVEQLQSRVKKLQRTGTSTESRIATQETKRDKLKRSAAEASQKNDELTATIDRIAAELEREAKKVKVTLLGGEAHSKRVLFVQLSADACVVGEIATEGPDTGFARKVREFNEGDPHAAFLAWARTRSPQEDCFVLLVRPDGQPRWRTLAGGLGGRGFDIGWDAWPPDRNLFHAE